MLKSRFLNFKDSIGISATSRAHITATNTANIQVFNMYGEKLLCSLMMIGKEAMRIAFAGVGRPIKLSACRVSTLNFASRNAENTGIAKAMKLI